MLARQPDRRKGERANSLGRRQAKRYILNNELTAIVYCEDQTRRTANILDISATGAYLIASMATWKPQVEKQISIEITGADHPKGSLLHSTVKYINTSSLLGESLCGIGVHFEKPLEDNILQSATGCIRLFGTSHEITN